MSKKRCPFPSSMKLGPSLSCCHYLSIAIGQLSWLSSSHFLCYFSIASSLLFVVFFFSVEVATSYPKRVTNGTIRIWRLRIFPRITSTHFQLNLFRVQIAFSMRKKMCYRANIWEQPFEQDSVYRIG